MLGAVPPGTAMTLDALKKAGVPVLAYGNFMTVAVNFLILAFVIFLMVKQINRLRRGQPHAGGRRRTGAAAGRRACCCARSATACAIRVKARARRIASTRLEASAAWWRSGWRAL